MTTPADNWQTPLQKIELRPGLVNVWRFRLEVEPECLETLTSLLDTSELAQAHRFFQTRDRNAYIVSHATLRRILADFLEKPPEQICLQISPTGKPVIPEQRIQFNLSHSGLLGLIAVTLDARVGIDVEVIRDDLDFHSVSRQFFAPGEIAFLDGCDNVGLPRQFFRCWTMKEAFLKGTGQGLTQSLKDFEVSLSGQTEVQTLMELSGYRWTIWELHPMPNYAGALAVEAECGEVRLWNLASYNGNSPSVFQRINPHMQFDSGGDGPSTLADQVTPG